MQWKRRLYMSSALFSPFGKFSVLFTFGRNMLYVTGTLSVSMPDSFRRPKSWSEINLWKCSPISSSNFSWGRSLPSFQIEISEGVQISWYERIGFPYSSDARSNNWLVMLPINLRRLQRTFLSIGLNSPFTSTPCTYELKTL